MVEKGTSSSSAGQKVIIQELFTVMEDRKTKVNSTVQCAYINTSQCVFCIPSVYLNLKYSNVDVKGRNVKLIKF